MNVPCKTCGRIDLPLHYNRQCPECFDEKPIKAMELAEVRNRQATDGSLLYYVCIPQVDEPNINLECIHLQAAYDLAKAIDACCV